MFAYFWRTVCGTTILYLGLTSHSLSFAQSITVTSDETGTLVQQEGNIYRIQGGTRSQGNLFHSFQQFGLNSNEIADFLSSPDIQNILGRVTGGDPSVINGLIQLTGGNSNLYLMNPAGIVFGGNASLNVPGSFLATTSDRIGFTGGWFNATGENNYQDLIGSPDRFAFLRDTPSAVINRGDLAVKTGNDVTFMGGTVINTGTISAPGGNITLAAVPGTNLVRISQAGRLLSVELSAEDITEGITPLELPELLTTPEIEEAIANLPTPQNGDVLISGQIYGETVNLMAANRVNVVDTGNPLVLTGDGTRSAPTVTIFPENAEDPLAYIFIDALVENYQDFLYNGKPGTVSFVVTPEENGISAIGEQLAAIGPQDQKVDEIHILSEGNEGNFWLGNAYISGETIDQYRDNFRSWRSSLSPEADILLYSCFTALGEVGESLMHAIAIETGADIAASTNLTGNSVLGGDWVLEKKLGNIEANLAFEQSILAEYQNTLAVFTASNAAELIQSIVDANDTASNDTINLLPNTIFSLSAPLQDISNIGTSGTVTINGFNSTIDAQGTSRIVTVRPDAVLTLNDVTIRNGSVPPGVGVADDGGAILVRQGTLNINNSVLENNTAADRGGAVLVLEGQLNISNSTISGNSAVNGGGIFNDRGTITIRNSTISGNSALTNGGGIYNGGVTGGISQTSTTTIRNSTISGNSTGGKGGGIFNSSSSSYSGLLNIYNSTVSENISPNNGAGIFNEKIIGTGSAIANIRNTIIAGNISLTQPEERDVKSENSSFSDLGNNLIGVVDGAIEFGTSGTLFGTSTNPLDPILSPLGNYTGDTQTHVPLPGSPAINTGSTTGTFSTDQRGLSRGTLVDIGSVEVTADLQITQSVSTDTPILNQDIGVVLTVQNLGLDPVGGVVVSSFIPSGITLNSVTSSAGSITFSNNTGLWTIGNLDGNFDLISEGNSVTLTLIGRVSDPDIFNLVFLNFIQSNALQGNDPNLLNNNSSANSILQANDPDSSNNTLQAQLTTIDPNILTSSLNSQPTFKSNHSLPSFVNASTDEAIFMEIEDTFSQEYEDYLEIEEEELITLQEAQNILRNIEAINGITPGVIYTYFKPKNSGLDENELWRFSPRENQPVKTKPEPSPDDELHLLVITPSDRPIHRHLPEVTREKAIAVAQNFRRTVTNVRRPNAYRNPAQQMYRWLVGSVAEELEERSVDSLSFVMDRGLRTIPVAALHDGNNFIIDRYSVGMMPSFFLTAPEYRDIKNRQVLAMGAEHFVEQENLPAVPIELELISNKLWQGEFYLNERFTANNLKQARSQKNFGIIHLATHGEFKPGKAENSYIQFWDEQLPLTRFRELGLNDAQIELLVLSACRTAFGDPDAELGFAGLAIATGVKTAIGSLWYVNDEGTLALMTGFYSQLDSAAIKVEALRQAQLSLLNGETRFENGQLLFPDGSFPLPPELLGRGDRVFSHPYFWSAFTTIGSPW